MIRLFIQLPIVICLFNICLAKDVYQEYRSDWLEKAEAFKPALHVNEVKAKQIVEIQFDESAYQHYNAVPVQNIDTYYNTTLKKQSKESIIDFGDHFVGKVQFVIQSTLPAHAPVQLRFKFAEMPAEMKLPFSSYEGTLSKAWLQEEIVTLHTMPDTVLLPRRYAFRYLKIEHLSSANDMDYYISDITCLATSSAEKDKMSTENPLSANYQKITDVSIKTLRNCMQTVFEDGPKRDRRIWIGDVKLQALANYYSFQNYDLVKRGLYLFAGTAREDGLLYGTLFEKPFPHPQKHHPIDYCLLYNTMLMDYYHATQDLDVLKDLWLVAKYQVEHVTQHISDEGIFTLPDDWWVFVDWNDELDKEASLHGIIVYALNQTWELAKLLQKQDEVPCLPNLINKMKKAAKIHYFDSGKGLFLSGPSKQISTASQTWMILADISTPKQGKKLFQKLSKLDNVNKPVAPYMNHYVLEAMIKCGMFEDTKSLLSDYWVSMIQKGADTFWEVYDPTNDFLSPYGSHLMNSACHAWSCTPVYFIRKYEKALFN